jgi:hypothetical protein
LFHAFGLMAGRHHTMEVRKMDFIEQIFGFSPDGGSGAFEVLLFLIPIAGLVILYRRRSKARQERRK